MEENEGEEGEERMRVWKKKKKKQTVFGAFQIDYYGLLKGSRVHSRKIRNT